ESLALNQETLGPDHPNVASAYLLLGQKLLMRDKLDEAEASLRQAFEMYRKIFDKSHPYQLIAVRFYAQALVEGGKSDEAEAVIRKDFEVYPNDLARMDMLAGISAHRNDWSITAERCAQILEIAPNDDRASWHLAISLIQAGRMDDYRRQCH